MKNANKVETSVLICYVMNEKKVYYDGKEWISKMPNDRTCMEYSNIVAGLAG